jgi:hypothetical protein
MNTTTNDDWSEMEILDLISYPFDRTIPGNFPPGTYEILASHMAQKHPDRSWTPAAVGSKFFSVRHFLVRRTVGGLTIS